MKYLKQPFTAIAEALAKTAKGFVTTDETGIYVTAKELAKTLQDVNRNKYGSSKDHDIIYKAYNPMIPNSVINNSSAKQAVQSPKEINGRK
jgi:hypothetical protein